MINMCIKHEVSSFTCAKDAKGALMYQNGSFWWLGGHLRSSAMSPYDFLLVPHSNHVAISYRFQYIATVLPKFEGVM